ncbi:hypothetical protein RFI_23608 [Reticulomyxa filosa]|uniref:Uncharacterized protein n=1 Tax=Reticulomyxa filosa TaxID=46433 RepID=X6MJC3_RETFI|nr:hypothetical protein RFI_23608 [Reticulomyxa filosa]|eukprot:ETO13761.1 hypothetical protein RFI_23608 [Reticulomyxa filosa]
MCSSNNHRWLKIVARWSYFVFSFLAILGSFVHLNIQFEDTSCTGSGGSGYNCVGRNLAWLTRKELSFETERLEKDINATYWRSVFSLEPEIFVNIWTPFAFAFLAFSQNFHGYKWDLLTGSWMKCLIFILFWNIFGVIGYAANWGVEFCLYVLQCTALTNQKNDCFIVFVGLWGILWLGLLYLSLAILKILKGEESEEPVLQLEVSYYLYVWFGIGKISLHHGEKIKDSFVATNDQSSFHTSNSDITPTTTSNYQNISYQQVAAENVSPIQKTGEHEYDQFTAPDQ